MTTYFKVKNHKSKKKCRNYTMIATLLTSFDTIVFIATTSNSFTLSVKGIELIAIPISAATAC